MKFPDVTDKHITERIHGHLFWASFLARLATETVDARIANPAEQKTLRKLTQADRTSTVTAPINTAVG